ncbi:glycosyltransferase [Nigerium massiliense]|uniref:glycosyltransferase n=1 Tax=Nigerium massiliense TaxID=1522317 RepID=UPI00058C40D0|nr:glycosyltransferase [Nigerium massiliense]
MIAFGTCVGGDGTKYRERSLPGIEGARGAGDLVLASPGDGGICSVYNRFVEQAGPDCRALVLMHDDVEIRDPEFRAKVLAAVDEPEVGVVGVVGGAGLASLSWWDARRLAGHVEEPRGQVSFPDVEADVDACDGLMLILSRAALDQLRFDEETFPAFHGYDVDICLQAREAGLRVVTRSIDVMHWTKGGFGNQEAFDTADAALRRKWPTWVKERGPLERVARRGRNVVKRVSSKVRGREPGF